MNLHTRLARMALVSLASFAALATYPAFAFQAKHNVSPATQRAGDLGQVNESEEMNLTVHLNMHNKPAFDEAVEQLYNPESPTYRKWMSDADLAKYAPSAAELTAVAKELEKHGLSVTSTEPNGLSIHVHGAVGNVQNAFQTHIHQFQVDGKTFRAHTEDAKLTGAAGNLVFAVSGLESHTVHPLVKYAIDPVTGKPRPRVAVSKVDALGGISKLITNKCLTAPTVATYTTPGASLPVGVYFGNNYAPSGLACDYTAAQLQAHYGLTAAYKAGFNGTGQTVVLLEAYGYPTMMQDANAFSKAMGLPQLTSANFQVVYPQGTVPANVQNLAGWAGEISMDIQWAHAMAPKAKIVVVATYGQDSQDFENSIQYITSHKLGNSVSNSWEEDTDIVAGPFEQNAFSQVLESAAAKGISFNFSTGDGGDGGFGTPVGASGVPSNNPYATGVGGTSILNDLSGSGQMTLGWGNYLTFIESGGAVVNPPSQYRQLGGGGGGESVFFAKPSWQSKLPGTGRQSPDVSALADPYTGVPVVLTDGGVQSWGVGNGGTSLASPIFTAIWAIANQVAGKPLGQAARVIAAMPTGAVTDVLPLSTPTNTAGTIYAASGPTYYSPSALISGALTNGQTGFVTGTWAPDPIGAAVLSFGTDTSLTVTKGWDNVTGFGEPNSGLTFLKAAAAVK